MKKVAILFDNLGPYHVARLKAAAAVCNLLAIEFGSSSSEYAWKASESEGFKRVVLNDDGASRDMTIQDFRNRLFHILDDYKPSVVLVPGWGHRGALIALRWGIFRHVPIICMSESTEWDEARSPIKEWMKLRIISLFSSALVGGTPHREYMAKLGMSVDRIFLGYDAVDNEFFAKESEAIKDRNSESGKDRKPYFLASARFIQKKNLHRLLQAYSHYRSRALALNDAGTVFDLVLLGDGALRLQLEKLCTELRIADYVQMPGFKQYEELPFYYAHAGAFIHASTTEQWGLVVNEAMSSGLPVLVSNRCGCSLDLVRDGENGWIFDPTNERQLAEFMLRISLDKDARLRMGGRSREIIAEWGPERFASGVKEAVEASLVVSGKRRGLLNRLILSVMTRIL